MNTQRITLTAFIAYFCMSGVLSTIGLISGPMAERYGVTVTEITSGFSYLSTGLLIGAALAIELLERVELRRLQIFVFGLVGAALLALGYVEQTWIWPLLGVTGVGLGIGLAGAALTIARTYSADRRASMLVVTDAAFSVAGFACASLTIYFLSQGLHWSSGYQFVGGLAFVLVVLAAMSRYPAAETGEETDLAAADESTRPVWSPNLWLCIVALFLYTLGQTGMLWWLPQHLQTTLGADAASAGAVVGRFWAGMFAAQLFVSWWVFHVGVVRLLLLAATLAFVFTLPLWMVTSVTQVGWLGALWGFMNLAFLKIAISFATELQQPLSPRLVSALLFGATTGTAISPWLSSQIVAASGTLAVLQFASLCYFGILLIVLVVVTRARRWPGTLKPSVMEQ